MRTAGGNSCKKNEEERSRSGCSIRKRKSCGKMWIPTHVNVTVHKARDLRVKGRSGANDPYVSIHLNDMKYTTSVKTRSTAPEWNENCDMPIPTDLRHSVVQLSVHHRNLFSMDDFLGQTNITLQHYPIYDRPQSRWYSLAGRRGSRKNSVEDDEVMGEVQVTLTFMVQSQSTPSDQTVAPSPRFHRQRSLSFKALASRVGMKLTDRWRSQNDLKDSPLTDLTERKFPVHSVLELDKVSRSFHHLQLSADDDEIFAPNEPSPKPMPALTIDRSGSLAYGHLLRRNRELDDRSTKDDQEIVLSSSAEETCSANQGLNVSTTLNGEILRKRPVRPLSLQTLPEESHESKKKETMETINNAKNASPFPTPLEGIPCGTPVYSSNYIRAARSRHSYIGCGETPPMVAAYRLNEIEDFMTTEKQRLPAATTDRLPSQQNILDDKDHFEGYDRDDLIKLVLEQQSWIQLKQAYVQDLETYIDGLLIRVLDTNHQAILENPYNRAGKRKQQPRKADDSQKKALNKSKKKRLIDIFKIWKQ